MLRLIGPPLAPTVTAAGEADPLAILTVTMSAERQGDAPDRRTVVVVSGYFNPLHRGHLSMLEAAGEIGDVLVALVNNDVQQRLKKGRVILTEEDRLALVAALRVVDEAALTVDEDTTVCRSLEEVARRYPRDRLVFANGGDRSSPDAIAEAAVCERLGIELAFGVGGDAKLDSSTRINVAMGREPAAR